MSHQEFIWSAKEPATWMLMRLEQLWARWQMPSKMVSDMSAFKAMPFTHKTCKASMQLARLMRSEILLDENREISNWLSSAFAVDWFCYGGQCEQQLVIMNWRSAYPSVYTFLSAHFWLYSHRMVAFNTFK